MSVQSYSLVDLLEGLALKVFARLFVARPGTIERYDEVKQLIDARPSFKESYVNADGDGTVEDPVLISNVPVFWLSGGGAYLSLPLEVGDPVLLVYLDRSLDRWKTSGGTVDPVDVRRHHPSDAIAIAGLQSLAAPLQGVSRTNAVLAVKQGARVCVGSADASEVAALASKVETELGKLWAKFNAHTHTGPFSGPTAVPADVTGSSSAVGSQTLHLRD